MRVRRRGHGQRRAAELVVLARAGAFERRQPACVRRRRGARARPPEVVRADLDPPADRPRARGDGVELRAQPVRRGLESASVVAIRPSGGRRSAARSIPSRRAWPTPGACEWITRRATSPAAARARSAVASVQRSSTSTTSYSSRATPSCARERGDARADQLLLVASGDDDARAQAHGSGAPLSTALAARLVVLVAVVREHADASCRPSVPDRERAAAVVDEAGLVEAVAPRHVLERVLADRRPEARRDVPLHVLAGDRAARDLAHVERLAPVLDGQVAAGGGVVRERHVARGEHAVGAGAHAGVDHDPAVADVEPGGLGQPGAGRDPGGHQDQRPRQSGSRSGTWTGARRSPRRRRRARASTPSVFQPGADPSTRLRAEPGLVRDRLVADQRHLQAAHGQRGGRLAADEARADHDCRFAPRPPCRAARARWPGCAAAAPTRPSRPGTGSTAGSAPVASTQAS